MERKILLIDDDENIVTLIRTILREEGYNVIYSHNGEDGLKKARNEKPDLILLDIVLPSIGGLEVCQMLRKDSQTKFIPIIMLTGFAVSSEDKVKGLDTGADDYLTKPFNKAELIARVNALLRRIRRKKGTEKVLKEDEIVVNLDKHTVFIKNESIELAPKEFALLCLLLKKKEKVLTRDFLAKSIWGHEYTGETRTIDMTVAHLRSKLGPYGKKIKTVEKIGYKFT